VTRVAVAVLCACTAPLASQSPRIEDNSFLIEEAYNQERGVVQHISTWQRSLVYSGWDFAFTQEWPLVTQQHQLSYTLLVGSTRNDIEFGGAGLNYRYQLLPADQRVALAPRLTALVPVHHEHLGVQLNVPVSVRVGSAFVAHANGGVTQTTRATTLYNLGGSVVWLARSTLNVLCEVVGLGGRQASVAPESGHPVGAQFCEWAPGRAGGGGYGGRGTVERARGRLPLSKF
jgi:hypothetical protein